MQVSIKYLLLNLCLLIITSAIASDLRRILPLNLRIREGEDLQLRLTRTLPSTTSCYVKTPLQVSFNLLSQEPDSENRIGYWTEDGECGVLARNVTKNDAGMWRLTAKNSTDTLVDTSFVQVLDKVESRAASFSIQSGLGYTLTLDDESRYCSIHQPHTDETLLVGGECKIELHQPTATVDGHWSATAGVIGQLEEVPVKADLNVFRDRLTTGYTRNNLTNTISAYCNLRDSHRGLEFCRFSRPDTAQTGFQLSEGLHSGRYGYYGSGLSNGECGITITAPTAEDYGQWLCSVGVKDEEPFGSFVWVNSDVTPLTVIRAELPSTSRVTTVLNAVLTLRCEVSVAISYCWFRSPDGQTLTPRPLVVENEDDLYKYVGLGFGKGQCGIEIKHAVATHEGQWTCHMGPEPHGFELNSTITVMIAETPLAAKEEHIVVAQGEILTLECRTVPTKVALDYCRFFMPDGTGIHIDDEVVESNALILDGTRHWFSSGNLKYGDCGLKVDAVSSRHFGTWTCGAKLESDDDTNMEAFAAIVVEEQELITESIETTTPSVDDNLTAAATTGIVTGVLVLVALLAGGSMYVVKRIRARGFEDRMSEADTVSVSPSSNSSGSVGSEISLHELRGARN